MFSEILILSQRSFRAACVLITVTLSMLLPFIIWLALLLLLGLTSCWTNSGAPHFNTLLDGEFARPITEIACAISSYPSGQHTVRMIARICVCPSVSLEAT